MRRTIRKAGAACGAAFASAALLLSTSTGASAVTTAVAVGGLGTPDMHEIVINPLLGGKLARENTILDGVEWPAQAGRPGSGQKTLGQSITLGIASLNTHFDAALARLAPGEQFTVVGFSAGSLVVNDMMRELAADPNAPSKDKVKFILVADSSRQELIKGSSKYNSKMDYTYRPAPETVYDIDVVTGEYDGMADLPDRIFNFLAVANAIAGGMFVHVPMMFSDYAAVTPQANITKVTNSLGGTTTTYLVPTKTLPLVQLLPFLKPREAELKAKIDAGYTRNDNRVAATSTARALAAPAVVADTADAPSATADVEAAPSSAVKSSRKSGKSAAASEDASDEAPVKEDSASTDPVTNDDDESTAAAEAEAAEDAAKADSAKEDAAAEGDKAATKDTGDDDAKGSADSDASGESTSAGTGSSDSGSSE